MKENGETLDQKWLKANTKSCPTCGMHIIRNNGCNVIACRGCKEEFCWNCLKPWKDHEDQRHGSCSVFRDQYVSQKQIEKMEALAEERKEIVNKEIDDYRPFLVVYQKYKL